MSYHNAAFDFLMIIFAHLGIFLCLHLLFISSWKYILIRVWNHMPRRFIIRLLIFRRFRRSLRSQEKGDVSERRFCHLRFTFRSASAKSKAKFSRVRVSSTCFNALMPHRIGLRAAQSSARFAQKSVRPGYSVGTADPQMTSLRNISFLGSKILCFSWVIVLPHGVLLLMTIKMHL